MAVQLVQQSTAELGCVAAQRERLPLGALLAGELQVACGERGPAGLQLDAERAASEVDRLDERGADPAGVEGRVFSPTRALPGGAALDLLEPAGS